MDRCRTDGCPTQCKIAEKAIRFHGSLQNLSEFFAKLSTRPQNSADCFRLLSQGRGDPSTHCSGKGLGNKEGDLKDGLCPPHRRFHRKVISNS